MNFKLVISDFPIRNNVRVRKCLLCRSLFMLVLVGVSVNPVVLLP